MVFFILDSEVQRGQPFLKEFRFEDTPVSTAPAAKEDDSNEDDGDYFNDLLSILNKRS